MDEIVEVGEEDKNVLINQLVECLIFCEMQTDWEVVGSNPKKITNFKSRFELKFEFFLNIFL